MSEQKDVLAQGANVRKALNAIAPAVEHLACHREQCDMDGVMVKVSRQALDEVLNTINELAITPRTPAATESQDDPTANPAWNDGCDFAMTQLCIFLGVDQNDVRWDAATETVEGDVQAVIGNILRAKFGEDWGPDGQSHPSTNSEGK